MSGQLTSLEVSETLQRMKRTEPQAYRAVIDNIELGGYFAHQLEIAGGAS